MKLFIFRSLTVSVLLLSFMVFSPTQVSAIDCKNPASAQEAIQCGASGAAGQDASKQGEVSDIATQSGSSLSTTIKRILNVLSAIVAVVSVVMIIVGGLRYVTSAGKQESISAAKNTIVYALVGLIIVAFAQIIVQFVLREATGATQTSSAPACVSGRLDSGPDQGKPC